MMEVVIETKRLLLRKFTESDAALLFHLNEDPAVTRYTFDPVKDLDHARQILEQVILPQYALYNHGRWAVLRKPELEFIGWCGLKYIPQRDEVDLGYRFAQQEWGKGYATEAAFACINYGFEKLHLKKIIGRAVPQNAGSLHVLEKCGMQYRGEEFVDGHPSKTYEIYAPSRD